MRLQCGTGIGRSKRSDVTATWNNFWRTANSNSHFLHTNWPLITRYIPVKLHLIWIQVRQRTRKRVTDRIYMWAGNGHISVTNFNLTSCATAHFKRHRLMILSNCNISYLYKAVLIPRSSRLSMVSFNRPKNSVPILRFKIIDNGFCNRNWCIIINLVLYWKASNFLSQNCYW